MTENENVRTPLTVSNNKSFGPMYRTIRYMEVQEKRRFPLEKMMTIRAYCSQIKLTDNKQYVTESDKEARELVVTRLR